MKDVIRKLWVPVVLSLILWALLGLLLVLVIKPFGWDGYISGSEAARDVITECERGSAACDAELRRVNSEIGPHGLRIFEDGSVVRER